MEIDSFKLRKIAFLCSITGIILLAFFTNFLQEQRVSLKELNESMLNQKVSVKGIVSEKEINYSGHLVFYLNEENNRIKVIAFNPSKELMQKIINGKQIEINATVSEFKEELELILIEVTSVD